MIFGALVLNDDISKGFFRLLNFSYFGLLGGGGGGGSKRAKNSPKRKKKLHMSHAISQEQYSI